MTARADPVAYEPAIANFLLDTICSMHALIHVLFSSSLRHLTPLRRVSLLTPPSHLFGFLRIFLSASHHWRRIKLFYSA